MAFLINDVNITDAHPKTFDPESHISYILSLDSNKEDYLNAMSEYLKMSGVYWGCNSLALLGKYEKLKLQKQEICEYVRSCECPCGGYSPSKNHNPHLLYTLSALQIMLLVDAMEELNTEKIVTYVTNLQNEDGSFCGDEWGEVDTRFSFCALAILSLLNRMSAVEQDIDKIVVFVMRSQNFDQGFGSKPGSESHAGQIYCCLGVLALTGRLHLIDADKLGWWLSERQLPSGGLNGRPEKMPDVCYSWWVLASLAIIGRLSWISKEKLQRFILACQDDETGGFTDRPNDMPDPFHTVFGISGLSLLQTHSTDLIRPINPIFCLPQSMLPAYIKYQILPSSNK